MSIRIAVTGWQGQVACALGEAGGALNAEIVRLGRLQLDLAAPETIQPALKAAAPHIIVNAAANTAVDQAEREPEVANSINGMGAGVRRPILMPISSAEYPTPAHRPANSRLNCAKLARVYGIELPYRQDSLKVCLKRLTSEHYHHDCRFHLIRNVKPQSSRSASREPENL
jgi:dTDP-4-dehydrorhamnose reductase